MNKVINYRDLIVNMQGGSQALDSKQRVLRKLIDVLNFTHDIAQ